MFIANPQAQTARKGMVPIKNFTRPEWNIRGLYSGEATFIIVLLVTNA